MADYNLSDFVMEVGKAVSILAATGVAWKIAVWVVGIVIG